MDFTVLLDAAAKSGIWAIMSVSFIVYILKKNDEREKRYIETIGKNQEVIMNLSDSLKCVDDISEDVKQIKVCLADRKRGSK